MTRKIADIITGIGHRREMGDIDSLARSIAELVCYSPSSSARMVFSSLAAAGSRRGA
jgi:hypothetical protein